MSKCNWTQGPWQKVTGKTYCAVRVDSGVIADMRIAGGYYNTFDADLIAAAPEMYDALDVLMDATGPGDAEQLLAEERENIMALLAKARGQS